MVYIPEVRWRSEEYAQKHKYRLEDMERAEENARHLRALGRTSRPWLGTLLTFAVVAAVLFVVFLFVVPSDTIVPIR